ncbi:hypothetical protein BFJ68_g10839 [Fusarium oxysporum]|uniref:Uncharacterized protein n=1 Tax=Fusarium oxysporum TaxID=5507 RepID=A0A420QJM0_FUSOX|nr:hypothetical protein BFJ67_g5297 [Fusarium oxysporum f. sp. cepae]RKK54040.1 hypothetical protein BFJ66_g4799 [Fusarium oxysporum f. sp. cepae]RKL04983.1 hypothetical protein BFJ68_g10839 [Fusarium oxysporum]
MDPSKATHLRRSSRKKVLTTSFHSGRPRTVPSKGGNASTHSTETIGHSQARASLGKTRTGIIAASIGDRTKEAQATKLGWWLQDAAYSVNRGRDYNQKGIVQNLCEVVLIFAESQRENRERNVLLTTASTVDFIE